MLVRHIKTTAVSHEFELQVRGSSVQFSVLKNFRATGYVLAHAGDIWPGNISTVFESVPIVDENRQNPWRVRLTRLGVDMCVEALNAKPEQKKCQCAMCQESEMVAA